MTPILPDHQAKCQPFLRRDSAKEGGSTTRMRFSQRKKAERAGKAPTEPFFDALRLDRSLPSQPGPILFGTGVAVRGVGMEGERDGGEVGVEADGE